MKVFVTGATGYIGKEVALALFRAGHRVFGLVRNKDAASRLKSVQIEPILGDLNQPETYQKHAASCDAIVHTAAENGPQGMTLDRKAIQTLIDTARLNREPRTFIYTSGVWVLGSTGDNPADETASTSKPPALVSWRVAHEKHVLAANDDTLVTAVVRPGIVFGGTKGLTMDFFKAAMKHTVPSYVGDGKNRWATVHKDDVADLYTRVVEAAHTKTLLSLAPDDRIFHAVDGTTNTVHEIATAVSHIEGEDGKVKSIPIETARQTMGPIADALALDQVVLATRSADVLGWKPRYRGFIHNLNEFFEEWARSL